MFIIILLLVVVIKKYEEEKRDETTKTEVKGKEPQLFVAFFLRETCLPRVSCFRQRLFNRRAFSPLFYKFDTRGSTFSRDRKWNSRGGNLPRETIQRKEERV